MGHSVSSCWIRRPKPVKIRLLGLRLNFLFLWLCYDSKKPIKNHGKLIICQVNHFCTKTNHCIFRQLFFCCRKLESKKNLQSSETVKDFGLWLGGVVWHDTVGRCGASGVVDWRGGVVWWSGVVEWRGWVAWWSGVAHIHGPFITGVRSLRTEPRPAANVRRKYQNYEYFLKKLNEVPETIAK